MGPQNQDVCVYLSIKERFRRLNEGMEGWRERGEKGRGWATWGDRGKDGATCARGGRGREEG